MLVFITTAFVSAFYVRFPKKYKLEIEKYCADYSLDFDLVCGIIWTESKFNPNALSKAGARGLMQLMPSTAQWCASKLGVKYYTDMLFVPEYNIMLGTYYYTYLYNRFGDENLALSAYNAGESNVRDWVASGLSEPKFKETQNYLKRTNYAKKIYKKIYS